MSDTWTINAVWDNGPRIEYFDPPVIVRYETDGTETYSDDRIPVGASFKVLREVWVDTDEQRPERHIYAVQWVDPA